MSKKALSLLEIIISMVILALVVSGIAAVFVSSKKLIQHQRFRMAGGEIGKQFLEPLQAYIRGDSWGNATSNCFESGNISQCPDVSNATNTTVYIANYTISNHTTDLNLKKVNVNITWTE